MSELRGALFPWRGPPWRGLVAAVVVGLSHQLRYRTELGLQLLSAALVAALNAGIWTTAARSAALIAGEPGEVWRAQVLIAWAGMAVVSSRVHDELGARFRDGQIAVDLLRPMPAQLLSYARDLGRALSAFCFSALPLLLLCFAALPMRWPERPGTWALWVLSLLLGHAVSFNLSFIIAVASVRARNITGLNHLLATLMAVFSGALLPLKLLPGPLEWLAEHLPFHTLGAGPAAIFLERGDGSAVLSGQLAWAAGLALGGAFLWARASWSMSVEGG